jgi:hypothetical protein
MMIQSRSRARAWRWYMRDGNPQYSASMRAAASEHRYLASQITRRCALSLIRLWQSLGALPTDAAESRAVATGRLP